ncbi:uncharacterized protein LACBIDRAFT_296054 [Laccaria bicolor S238N-H82]|uniref:Predicted protein n=1 Tax=Laccaria bicolor (strain S238N-H82 / ATCC MYA-4686) TaxID=486041 RepID=B0E2U3_LACBS|nr:uncharacterized protein LACBIDRAFT_296054 [Laccaria bicolor S238N-H82]EDQ98839.1 predicted protein [Laccaria bicolor S238N-H82]|eukprot:XP_001890510.1 predicted protein [Laccaria bicolor S238N-H82]
MRVGSEVWMGYEFQNLEKVATTEQGRARMNALFFGSDCRHLSMSRRSPHPIGATSPSMGRSRMRERRGLNVEWVRRSCLSGPSSIICLARTHFESPSSNHLTTQVSSLRTSRLFPTLSSQDSSFTCGAASTHRRVGCVDMHPGRENIYLRSRHKFLGR